LPLTQYFGGGNEAAGWQKTMMVYGAAAVIFFLIAFISTKERVMPPPRQKSSVKDDLKDLINNKPWLILLAATIFMVLFVATRISVIPHYFKYYVEHQQLNLFGTVYNLGFVELTSAFNGIGQISAIIGVLCTKWFASLFGKKKAFIILFIISIISNAAFYALKPSDVSWIFILQIIYSLTSGPLTPLIWAMYADSADYSEWKNKRRATGLVFSASTMSQKFGWAFGTAFAGWLLTLVGYQANIAQSEAVKEGLRLLVSLIPAFIGILSLIVMLFYKLDEDTMSNIASELEERRKNRNDDLAAT
jgi:GPH family glycoside/pentoside/hexuronide:cation symporter